MCPLRVEGSVRKAGGRVRVTAQLINADTGHHIWAERYDRDLEDIFTLQDEITREIATIIEPAIARSEDQRIGARPPSDLAAWEHCVRGFALIYSFTREANEEARSLFHRAIEIDPHYARAFSGLAFTYLRDIRFFGAPDLEQWRERAEESARRAIALDETDSEARTMLVRCLQNTGRIEDAIAEARRAVDLNPNNADANNMLGSALSTAGGRFEEGIPSFERALQLNPSDSQHQVFATQLALANLGAGRYESAERFVRDALRRRPDFMEGIATLTAALGYLDRVQEAQNVIQGREDAVRNMIESHVLFAPALKECLREGLRRAGVTA